MRVNAEATLEAVAMQAHMLALILDGLADALDSEGAPLDSLFLMRDAAERLRWVREDVVSAADKLEGGS